MLEKDKSKLEQLYHLYGKKMWYVANQILQDEYEAEDAVHEAFVRISNYLHHIPEELTSKEAFGYVIKCVKHTSINVWYQKKRRDQWYNIDDILYLQDDKEMRKLIEIEETYHIVGVLKRMPQPYKEVLYLSLVEELSVQEIGKLLGKSRTIISVWLHRGKKKLIDMLKKEGIVWKCVLCIFIACIFGHNQVKAMVLPIFKQVVEFYDSIRIDTVITNDSSSQIHTILQEYTLPENVLTKLEKVSYEASETKVSTTWKDINNNMFQLVQQTSAESFSISTIDNEMKKYIVNGVECYIWKIDNSTSQCLWSEKGCTFLLTMKNESLKDALINVIGKLEEIS